LHIGITVMEDADMNQPPAKKPSAPSAQHTKLAEVYGKLDPDLSPELALLWQRVVHYHTTKMKPTKAGRQLPAADAGQLAFDF
jgi:hypothetical protein